MLHSKLCGMFNNLWNIDIVDIVVSCEILAFILALGYGPIFWKEE